MSFEFAKERFNSHCGKCDEGYLPVEGRVIYYVRDNVSNISNARTIRVHEISKVLFSLDFDVLVINESFCSEYVNIDSQSHHHNFEAVVENIKNMNPPMLLPNDTSFKSIESYLGFFEEQISVYRPQFVIINSSCKTALLIAIIAKKFSIPIFYEMNGFRNESIFSTNEIELEQELILQSANRIIVPSHDMFVQIEKIGVSKNRLRVIENCPTSMGSAPSKNIDLSEHALPKNARILAYFGGLCSQVNLSKLCNVIARLRKNRSNLVLLICGGSYEELSSHFENDVPSWIIHVERVSHFELGSYYELSDIMVLPEIYSDNDGLNPPFKVIEYLSKGKYVIAPNYQNLQPFKEEKLFFKTYEDDNSLYELIDGKIDYVKKAYDVNVKYAKRLTYKNKIKKGIFNSGEKRFKKGFILSDPITEFCFAERLNLDVLDRHNFREQILSISNPDDYFFFLESAWHGKNGSWQFALTSPGLKHPNAQALLEAITLFKELDIPIVFWNKEDPMHYEMFFHYANLADFIFTTDNSMIPKYKRDTGNENVFSLKFAAPLETCNPFKRFEGVIESVCFAGTYYAENHADRKRQMDNLLPTLIKHNGAIYNRVSDNESPKYKYPAVYQNCIREGVPFDEMVKLYKQFQVFLNVNTITGSETMMSRRVYELLSSGTPVVSTPSKAINKQFPGIVLTARNENEADMAVGKLLSDPYFWAMQSHKGIREVVEKHTYEMRAKELLECVGIEKAVKETTIHVVVFVQSANLENILWDLAQQTKQPDAITFVYNGDENIDTNLLPANARLVDKVVFDSNHAYELTAFLDTNHLYFKNYLRDVVNYFKFDGVESLVKTNCFIDSVEPSEARRHFIKPRWFSDVKVQTLTNTTVSKYFIYKFLTESYYSSFDLKKELNVKSVDPFNTLSLSKVMTNREHLALYYKFNTTAGV